MRRGPDGVFLFRTACPDVRRRRLAQARNNRVTAQRRSARRVARESAVSPAFMAGPIHPAAPGPSNLLDPDA
ncbi:hypothetical protein G6F57_022065 [Rhizopus arrhizus]|nr:hypothetical protein G6F57_022065 [Rhizopus arrhizus]